MKSRLYYFKIAFLPIGLGLFAGLFVYNLIESLMDGKQAILRIFTLSLVVSFVTALLMGVLNMIAKIDVPNRQTK